MKRKILVLAYSISPVRGSEFSVAWNHVKEMSSSCDLIVLYGAAGEHMGDVSEVEDSLVCRELPNVRFVAVQPTLAMKVLNALNEKGILVYTFYFAYKLWHRKAYEVAETITANESIDLIHYLGPIGYREPGYLWKLRKPYVWGPIGGVRNRPAKFMLKKNLRAGVKASLYNLVNSLQFRFSSRVRSAFMRSNLLLASTTEVRQLIHDVHGVASIYLPENAITQEMLANQRLVKVSPGESVNIIWVGRIDAEKALDILLSALSLIKDLNWNLCVVGGGALLEQCKSMSERLGIDHKTTWVGAVPRSEVNKHYRKAHLHAITSLAEANTTVIWEAMSFGIPTITLDHCGMHDTVCDRCGVRIPVTTPESTIKNFAAELKRLISEPEVIPDLSNGVAECSNKFSWGQRRADWLGYYEAAIAKWHASQRT